MCGERCLQWLFHHQLVELRLRYKLVFASENIIDFELQFAEKMKRKDFFDTCKLIGSLLLRRTLEEPTVVGDSRISSRLTEREFGFQLVC